MWVWSLSQEHPLEECMATHFSILAWRIPSTEESGGLWSVGLQKVGHDWSNLVAASWVCRLMSFTRVWNFHPFFFFKPRLINWLFWTWHTACRILVLQLGIEPQAMAVKAPSPKHLTTRELPPVFLWTFSSTVFFSSSDSRTLMTKMLGFLFFIVVPYFSETIDI